MGSRKAKKNPMEKLGIEDVYVKLKCLKFKLNMCVCVMIVVVVFVY